MIKPPSKQIEYRRSVLQLNIKTVYDRFILNIEMLMAIPLKSGKRQVCLYSLLGRKFYMIFSSVLLIAKESACKGFLCVNFVS